MGVLRKIIRVLHIIPLSITFRHLFIKPITVQYPEERLTLPSHSIGMHKLDLNKCIGCGTCARVCPNKTIEMVTAGVIETKLKSGKVVKKPKKHPNVYLGRCMFCGLCEENCPTKAIKLTRNYEIAGYTREELLKTYEDLAKTREEV